MPTTFSTELVALCLAAFDPYSSEDTYDLISCASVNRVWYAVARERLYKTVYVQSPHDKTLRSARRRQERLTGKPAPKLSQKATVGWEDSEDEGDINEDPHEQPARLSLDSASRRVFLTFQANPDLAKLREELVYQGKFEDIEGAHAVRRFLQVCPNLRTIRLIDPPGARPISYRDLQDDEYRREPLETVFEYIVKHAPSTTTVDACVTTHWSGDALSALSGLHHLRHLRLWLERDNVQAIAINERSGKDPDTSFDFQLQTLDLGAVLEPPFFARVTESSHDSLLSLSTYVRRRALDLSGFSQLKHLTLHGGRLIWKSVGDTLATLPHQVTSLKINRASIISILDQHCDDAWRGRSTEHEDEQNSRVRQMTHPDEQAFSALVPRLPANIKRLAFGEFLDRKDFEAITSALADPTWLPELQALEYVDELWRHTGDESGDADKAREEDSFESWDDMTAAEYRQARTALRTACADRGVELVQRKVSWDEDIFALDPSVPRMFARPHKPTKKPKSASKAKAGIPPPPKRKASSRPQRACRET